MMASPGNRNKDTTRHKTMSKNVDCKEDALSSVDIFRTIARESVFGYIFWCLFQALVPMIWFYPLNELEISGYEAFAVFYFTPLLCAVPGVLGILQNKWILTLLRLLAVLSLYSFQAPTTLSRLVILACGTGAALLVVTATLWNPVKAVRYRTFWGLMVGLHAFLASRVWYVTFVPAWWDNCSNNVVLACGGISVLGYLLEEPSKTKRKEEDCVESSDRPSWLLSGLGLGSLLFLTQCCFGEASLITRWTVKGYPDPGPEPLPWGSLVLLSLAMGSLLRIRGNYQALACAILATLCQSLLLICPNPYLGFTAGCILGMLTMSFWSFVVDKATQCNAGLCFFVANLTYVIQTLFWVWTVAFNFVPYGELTREHTDWLVGGIMAGIMVLATSGKSTDKSHTSFLEGKESKTSPQASHYVLVIFLAMLVGQAGIVKRYVGYNPRPTDEVKGKVFTAGIWTYHFGYDNKGWQSVERAGKMINDTGVDVLTLLESDASKLFLGNNDLAAWLGEKLDFYVDFGPSTKDHTWGNLIISRYPIIKSTHHLLPSPKGELAPAITATIDISGQLVDFVVTHMGNDRDTLDRKLQSEFLAEELRKSVNPAVFLGYVTSSPGSTNYNHLINHGGVKDIDPKDMDRWCEYIMYKKLIRLGYARISHGGLSDTEVQIARFEIPQDLDNFKDHKKTTTDPKKRGIDENLLFSPEFGKHHRGHGYFDYHGYHMDTPKYFYS